VSEENKPGKVRTMADSCDYKIGDASRGDRTTDLSAASKTVGETKRAKVC
jgi:hypothetical protein